MVWQGSRDSGIQELRIRARRATEGLVCVLGASLVGVLVVGCHRPSADVARDRAVYTAIEHFAATRTASADSCSPPQDTLLFFASFVDRPTTQPTPGTNPAESSPSDGYWRRNVWHQMGYEGREFGMRGLWRGFKTAFWDVENAFVLTATMGASVAIRETGVDDAIRRRTRGPRRLGDFDEPIQLLGHPGTHFAATGVLWLTSTLTQDMKQHEVARTLAEALAVNGITTIALKAATNTRAPNGDSHAWPSGHVSSAFTAAAVLNEYYGPLVGLPSLALAGLIGYQRIDSRAHDFSDVVVGGMLGYVIGTSIARDEKARFLELFGMKVVPFVDPELGASGLALYTSW